MPTLRDRMSGLVTWRRANKPCNTQGPIQRAIQYSKQFQVVPTQETSSGPPLPVYIRTVYINNTPVLHPNMPGLGEVVVTASQKSKQMIFVLVHRVCCFKHS